MGDDDARRGVDRFDMLHADFFLSFISFVSFFRSQIRTDPLTLSISARLFSLASASGFHCSSLRRPPKQMGVQHKRGGISVGLLAPDHIWLRESKALDTCPPAMSRVSTSGMC